MAMRKMFAKLSTVGRKFIHEKAAESVSIKGAADKQPTTSPSLADDLRDFIFKAGVNSSMFILGWSTASTINNKTKQALPSDA